MASIRDEQPFRRPPLDARNLYYYCPGVIRIRPPRAVADAMAELQTPFRPHTIPVYFVIHVQLRQADVLLGTLTLPNTLLNFQNPLRK